VSVTRLPTRQSEPEEPDDGLDELEELGDDAIISQQTAAHALQPRVVVSEESRSVVISEHPQQGRKTEPPRSAAPRATAEPTLIIRDRRKLDEMRQQIVERQLRKSQSRRSRSIYIWGALGVAAFVLGGIVAFLATDSRTEAPAVAAAGPVEAAPGRVEAQIEVPRGPSAAPPARSTAAQAATAVRLDDLPVEPAKKK
jgi:hypothetical protein